MRPRPLSILLLLALSSFVIAQAKGGEAGFMGFGGGGAGAIGGSLSGLSCLMDMNKLPIIAVILSMGGGVIALRKKSGGSIMGIFGPILGIMIIVQAAMSGALCRPNAMMYIMIFAILETIITADTGTKHPLMGIITMILTIPIFQMILSSPTIMSDPTKLFGAMIPLLLLSGGIDVGVGSIDFSGFKRGVWNGLKGGAKILKGPEKENTEEEIKKDIDSKLREIEEYIIELRKKAKSRINHLHKEAKKAARQESRAMSTKKRDKYAKIEERLERDENELTLLSKDISNDIQAIGDTTQRINNFEKTLSTELKKTFDMIIPFIREHSTDDAEKITKQGAVGGYEIKGDMQNAVKIRNSLQGSVNIILNGMASFAKLSVLMETVEKIFRVADTDLKDTGKTEKKKESKKKNEGKEHAGKLENDKSAFEQG